MTSMLIMFDGRSVALTEGLSLQWVMAGLIDQLIGGRYDLQFTPQTEREQVTTENIYLVTMLGLRIKMDCSIPINSIPRCSAIAEGWQLEEKQKETKDQIKGVAPSDIHIVEHTKIGNNWDNKHLSVIVRLTWSVTPKTRHQNTLTACNTSIKPHCTKPDYTTTILL